MLKPLLILIIGAAGTGKDTFVNMLRSQPKVNVMVSFTTREMREGEHQGVEHNFITIEEYIELKERGMIKDGQFLAYTFYGNNHYFTHVRQVLMNAINLYVIDEHGANEIHEKHADKYDIVTIVLTASESIRRARGVTYSRRKRDEHRDALAYEPDYTYSNEGDLEDMRAFADSIYKKYID